MTAAAPLPVEPARHRAVERLVLRVELGPCVTDALDDENTASRSRRTASVRSRAHLAVTRAAVAAAARRQGWRAR